MKTVDIDTEKLSEGLGRCPKNLQGTRPLTHFAGAARTRPNPMSLTLEYFLQKSKFLMMVRKMIVRKKYFWACKIGRNILPACCRYVLVELRQSIIKTHNRTIFLLASDCFSVWTNRRQIFRQKIFDCFAANLSLDK